MRERKNHHIVVTVTQSNSSALILERCCGVFLAPGDSTDPDNYMLLDMPLGLYRYDCLTPILFLRIRPFKVNLH